MLFYVEKKVTESTLNQVPHTHMNGNMKKETAITASKHLKKYKRSKVKNEVMLMLFQPCSKLAIEN
jgi:hypothetical protein